MQPDKPVQEKAILLADPDINFLTEIGADPAAAKLKPYLASTATEAQHILSGAKRNITGIFINPAISLLGDTAIVRRAHLLRPQAPIFYIVDSREQSPSTKHMGQLRLKGTLVKPVDLKQIVAQLSMEGVHFDREVALGEGDKLDADTEVSDDESLFVPLLAEKFLCGTQSFFDVYVRINDARFLKIVRAGDSFDPARVKSYIERGCKQFYMRKSAQKHYVAYCGSLAESALGNSKVGAQPKAALTLNQGQETMNLLRNAGLDDESVKYARAYVEHTHALAKALGPGGDNVIGAFMNDVAAFEHASGVAAIAALLGRPLGIETGRTQELIGMAALLHDVGLVKLGLDGEELERKLEEAGEESLTPEELKAVREHAEVGAQLVGSLRDVHPAVGQAILHHHDRRGKRGLLKQGGRSSMSFVSEIVGISEEFFHLLRARAAKPNLDLASLVRDRIAGAFSPQVVGALQKVFFTPSSSKAA